MGIFLDQTGDLVNILGMIGIALLTILIPIAVAIFNERPEEFEVLDRNVILDHVVNSRSFIYYIVLIYLPLILWNSLCTSWRFLALLCWIVGIYLLATVLKNSYHWMKGNKFPLRFDYLRKLGNINDMEGSWRSVWESKNINAQNEKEFFNIFSSTIDRLLKNDD